MLSYLSRWTTLILVNIASLLLALTLAEGLTRLLWTPPSTLSNATTARHPVYGWAPVPNRSGRMVTPEFDKAFAHTAQGLRGNTVFALEPGATITRRIMFLGDSFTYGMGAGNKEAFVARLQTAIPDAEIINTGANGYGQRQQLAILTTLGQALRPDTVVLMFFWNDLEDNMDAEAPQFALNESGRIVRTDLAPADDFDPLAPWQPAPRTTAEETPLWRKTWLYKLFKEGARGARHRWFGITPRSIRTAEQADAAWATTHQLLRLIKHQASVIDAELLLVSIPDYDRVDTRYQLKGQLPLNTHIESRLAAIARQLDINYFDLLPALRAAQAATDAPLYYATDRHLTPAGNKAVANLLLPLLQTCRTPAACR